MLRIDATARWGYGLSMNREPVTPAEDILPADGAPSRDSSLRRAFEIIEFFSETRTTIVIDDVVERLGCSRSTAYRYVRELCDAGFLVSRVGGRYSLAPRILGFARLFELTDPLYRAGLAVMQEYRRDDSALVLQDMSGEDQVICLHKEGPDELEHAGRKVPLRRARGISLPLFQGAASLSLLAWISPYRIRQTYLSSSDRIAAAGLARSWNEFRGTLARFRRMGYVVSRSEVNPVLVGIGVPVLTPKEGRLVGSLARIVVAPRFEADEERRHSAELLEAAGRIGAEYARLLSAQDRA